MIPNKKRRSQELFNTKEKSFSLSYCFTGLSEQEILSVIKDLSPGHLKVLSFMLDTRMKVGPYLYFKKAYIAQQVGVSPRTVQRAFKVLDEFKFTERMHRTNETSLHRIAIEFFRPSLIAKLTKYLPVLMIFLLISKKVNAATVHTIEERVSQNIVSPSLFTNQNQTEPKNLTYTGEGDGIKSNERNKKRKWYQFTTREGRRVSVSNPKIDLIKSIPLDGMNKHEMHQLTTYHEIALQKGAAELQKQLEKGGLGSVKKPFPYLIRILERLSRELNLSKDYSLFNELRKVIEHIPKTESVATFAEVEQVSPSRGKTKPVVSDFVAQQSIDKTAAHREKKTARQLAIEKDLENQRAAIECMFEHAKPKDMRRMAGFFPEHLLPYLTDSEREKLGINKPEPIKKETLSFNIPQVPPAQKSLLEPELVPYTGDDSVWEEVL